MKNSRIKAMSYDVAINKAWDELSKLSQDKRFVVKFLADEYDIDLDNRRVLSLSCNALAKDFTVILILHYLLKKLRVLPNLTGDWMSFKELSAVEGYLPAFRKRSIEPIIRKYGRHPEEILSVLDRLPGKRVNQGDVGIILEAFAGIPVLITLWRADEEFGPEANILFDKSITQIFCTEDIVVLAGIIAGSV
jgi:hypothetical protein